MNIESANNRVRVFSAPRQFDVVTLLVVTAAYAVGFAVLRAVSFPPVGAVIVAAFFTAVALGQSLVFDGTHPRIASAVVGFVFTLIAMLFQLPIQSHVLSGEDLLALAFYCLIFGSFFGYFAGVLVGFVFMIAHWVRLLVAGEQINHHPANEQPDGTSGNTE
ncbi:MAG: hypothetical protein JNL67_01015 [Planctomycetaceae bacterium]|nr:hypothetical protein [Planctomycetaceae bacterium]